MEFLYRPQTIDRVVIFTLLGFAGFFVFVVGRRLTDSFRTETPKRPPFAREAMTLLLVLLGIWVAYSTMRNQLRLAAETETNDEGNNIFGLEMSDPNLRCLYGNFAFDDPEACLRQNTKDSPTWSKAEFYVEESLFTLHKAGKDRDDWGSHYDDDIEYWAQDVEQDPTGMFSYYVVNRYGLSGGKTYLSAAHICIPDLCDRYDKVFSTLLTADRKFGASNRRICPATGDTRRMVDCTPRPKP